jgi:hypothetical protein
VAPWWQCHFFLCKRLDLVTNDINTSTDVQVRDNAKSIDFLCHPTFHQMRSAPTRPLCTRHPASGELDNECSLFCRCQASPGVSVRLGIEMEKFSRTDIIICGQFPSFAITLSLSMVSTLPTTSSKTCGLYFSTLVQQDWQGESKFQ